MSVVKLMVDYITEKEDLKEKYFKSKQTLDTIRSDMTLLKWEILSKAYKLGKEIWNHKFSVQRLAKDMELPYTTTKRCLSLDKASEKSWQLLKEGKISAFKLAQICMSKNSTYHDDIVAAVIEDNIPTHKIKSFKAGSIKDVNEWRHKKAVEKGYSREYSAERAINLWIQRGQRMMLLPFKSLPKPKQKKTIKNLKSLHRAIGRYINKNEMV